MIIPIFQSWIGFDSCKEGVEGVSVRDVGNVWRILVEWEEMVRFVWSSFSFQNVERTIIMDAVCGTMALETTPAR